MLLPSRFVPAVLLTALALASPAFADKPRTDTTVPVTQQRDSYNWPDRHAAVLERNKTVKPDVVFIGDSITHFWGGEPADKRMRGKDSWDRLNAGLAATNAGFGFDYIENVLWRVRHGELDGVSPKLIVIMIGTNNLGHKGDTPADCERGMKVLLADIRAKQPAAKILLLGVYPRREPALAKPVAETNALYSKMADAKSVFFLDLADKLGLPDVKAGAPVSNPKLFVEGLHPNAAGYAVVADALVPEFKKYLPAR